MTEEAPEKAPDLHEVAARLTAIENAIVSAEVSLVMAGKPGDLPHIEVIQTESGKLIHRMEMKQAIVNATFQERLTQLFTSVNLLQQNSLKLFVILSLVGSVIIYIAAKATGLG